MTHLDLCSGVGGFALAAHWAGYTTIGFCEIDPWCRRVLAKHWPEVPQHDDLTTLTADVVRGWHDGHLDLLTAGYPCQPFSHAGKRLGAEDDRHLWPHISRLVANLRPRWCLFENVAGHVSLGLDEVLADLEAQGYACGATVVPACAVNAPHRRDRVWIVANAAGDLRRTPWDDGHEPFDRAGYRVDVSNTNGSRAAERGECADAASSGDGRSSDRTGGGSHAGQIRMGCAGENSGTDDSDAGCAGLQGRSIGAERADQGAFGTMGGASPDCAVAHAEGGGLRRGRPSGQRRLVAIGGQAVADTASAIGEAWSSITGANEPCGEFGHRGVQARDGKSAGHEASQRVGEPDDGLPGRVAGSRLSDPRWDGDPFAAFGPDWEDGVPRVVATETQRVHKLKALGNAIVPQVAYVILLAMQAEVQP